MAGIRVLHRRRRSPSPDQDRRAGRCGRRAALGTDGPRLRRAPAVAGLSGGVDHARAPLELRRVGLPFGMAAAPPACTAVRLSAGQGKSTSTSSTRRGCSSAAAIRMSTRAAWPWPDNHLRYGLLSQAGAQLAAGALDPHWRADVLHAHDWHAAWRRFICVSTRPPLCAAYSPSTTWPFRDASPWKSAPRLGFLPSQLVPATLEFHGDLSFMKGALTTADAITTVSRPMHGKSSPSTVARVWTACCAAAATD